MWDSDTKLEAPTHQILVYKIQPTITPASNNIMTVTHRSSADHSIMKSIFHDIFMTYSEAKEEVKNRNMDGHELAGYWPFLICFQCSDLRHNTLTCLERNNNPIHHP